jgi:hypothetical protein
MDGWTFLRLDTHLDRFWIKIPTWIVSAPKKYLHRQKEKQNQNTRLDRSDQKSFSDLKPPFLLRFLFSAAVFRL